MEDNMNSALAISGLLRDLISQKHDDINNLDSIKINASDEGFDEINPVIDTIVDEENNHIGKLQQLVDLLSGGEEDIAEGKEETIEMIDNSDEFMESMTTMKKKLVLNENFDNVIDDIQAVEDNTFVKANKEHDDNKKNYEEAIKENTKTAEETIPKEGETGKKVTSKELKAMKLSESIFDEGLNPDFAQRCADDISEYVMTSYADLSNSDIRDILRRVMKHFSGPDYVESLKESLNEYDSEIFVRDIYNAISDVAYDYPNASRRDIEKAIEWFETHFYDAEGYEEEPQINHMTGVHESLEVKIAKEQINRFNEGKMPKNWNVETYLEKLTEKKHITDSEAKSLKEWYLNDKQKR